MKKDIKEIKFENKNVFGSNFDIVSLKEVFKRSPTDHSQYDYHRVSFYIILLCTKGKGTYNLNFKDYSFKKNSLFIIRKDNVHKFYKTDAQGTLLIFTKSFILNHSNKLEISNVLMLFNEMLSSPKFQLEESDYKELLNLIELAKIEYLSNTDNHSSVIIKSLMQIIFTKLFRLKSKDNPLFENNKHLSTFLNFQSSIEKNCFKNRKVSFYADMLGLSGKALNAATKTIVNKSAKSFITDVFIIHTKRLIINSDDPLTKIAYKVGFDEPTNFFKFFKKHAGIAPSQLRD